MSFKRGSACYALMAMVAILVIMVFSHASVIPTAKATANGLTYYVNDGSNFIHSATPFNFQTTDYNFSQTVLASGGILTTLTPRTTGVPYADLGLGYTFGKLGDIVSIPITGNGSYSVNIWLDINAADDIGNGPFFGWSGNTYTGVGGDTYGLGPTITNSGTIAPSDSVFLILNGNTYTIAQLQSGLVPGIDNNTLVGFWFGVINHATTTQFEIDLINGQPPAPVQTVQTPVGGVSISISKPQLLAPWISLGATTAIAASFVIIKRIKKRQN